MKLNSLIVAGLTATLMSTSFAYAQTAPVDPSEAMVSIINERMAQIPEVQAMVDALEAQGFTFIEIRGTMLGRAKILAYDADSMREIVMNANTGEVMRDIMREHDGSMAQGREAMQENMNGMEGGMDEGNMDGGNMDGGNMGDMGDAAGDMGDAAGNMGDNAGGMGDAAGGMGGN